jgi:PAS domain S-box-containing protein
MAWAGNQRRLADLGRAVALAAAYFTAGRLALLLAIPPGYASPVWPAAGIALAGVLLWGPAMVPAIWLGSFATHLANSFASDHPLRSIAAAGAIALGAAAQAALGRVLIRRANGPDIALAHEREVIRFLALGGPVACVVSATCGVAALSVAGLGPSDAAAFSWFTWWIGDAIGVLIFAPLVLIAFARPVDVWRPRRLSLGIPLAVTFALTVAAFLFASHWERDRARAEFERQAQDMSRAIEQDLNSYVEGFRSIATLYAGSHRVQRDEFHTFVTGLLGRHPGIRGVTWHPRVLDADRERFERGLRGEGFAHFRLTEYRDGDLVTAARRSEYVPVQYIEPGGENEVMLGYDSASRPERRVTLDRIRDSGELAFTDQVRLPLANADGVLVFVPVYRNGRPHETIAQRRAQLEGYIGGAIVLEDVMSRSLRGGDPTAIALWVESDRAPQDHRLLTGQPSDPGSGGFAFGRALAVPGLSWTLHAVRSADSLVAHRSPSEWFVLLGGLLLDSLLGTFLLILTGRAARVESLVAERTQQLSRTTEALEQELRERELAEQALRASENQFRSVTESANDAIIIADLEGRILRWNEAAHRYFGYREEEALGQPVAMLIPPRLRGAHETAVARLRAGGLPRLIDRTLEVQGLHKNGTEVPLEISLSTWCSDDGTYYSGILRDITERQRAEQELQRAKEAAEVGNRAKGDFLANMSHEIRTPMNAVIGMTGLLLDTPLDERQREFVETIRISGDHLLTVINEILDLSKIESGHLELEASHFDVRRCVEEAVELIAPRALEKGLALRQRIAADVPPLVSSDAGRLRQVLVNLIDNAVKFTERGTVDVEVAARAPEHGDAGRAVCELHFLVRDTGFGIPSREFERLFEPFTQADASVTRRFGGTGLGLTISKRLCERLGGRIWVESEVGQGSTFHFTIAVHVEAAPDFAPAALRPAPSRDHAARPVDAAKLRILLAEDNAVNQKVARLLLEQLGYTSVDVAGNGIEVIAALERQSYDVVLMDVQMPEMDGIDATHWIRGRWKRAPKIIAMTAHALAGDRERCLIAGMDGYLAKPIQSAELAAELSRVCATPESAVARPTASDRPLAALVEQIPDLAVVSEIVDDFAREARAADAQLRDAFANGDAGAARRIAHTLKSTTAMVGASELSGLAREIERLAAADDEAGARARMRGLDAAVEEAIGAVLAERDRLRAEG